MTITTTLNRIREHRPCREGWTTLLRHLGKTEAAARAAAWGAAEVAARAAARDAQRARFLEIVG